ncbi:Nedd8 activating enzyme [Paramicrosporidium saccamoebae]|uniref:NEDD8-activating enzyme E1 catalytic subunit n=1 Tax=Paramicrosporidium saccamoebae TaxID=1246581 RepID=A0A2H9TM92_9FUNG|nr:Nedd8 activating enzyme [Paramicrosporidium saccamoebae]
MGPRVLVVGAGALGSEIVVKLVALGFQKMEAVDMDTIEVSNLTRQSLFRTDHVGRYKAEIVAESVNVYPSVECTFRVCRVETLPMSYFSSFGLILCGVDNVETRLWLNDVACRLSVTLIEGGTEGWMGHVRLVMGGITPCLYCTRFLHAERETWALCTLTGTPTNREQIVAWTLTLEWPRLNAVEFDVKDEEHLNRFGEMAIKRAAQYGIDGIDKPYILETIRAIVPTVISTTSLIAGISVLIAQQLTTNCFTTDANYWFYNGVQGAFLQSHSLQRDPNCPICHPNDPR